MKTAHDEITFCRFLMLVVVGIGVGSMQLASAQVPEDTYIPEATDFEPSVSLGQSKEAKAAMEQTDSSKQENYVRPQKPDDADSSVTTTDLITYLTIFVLAIFLGFEIITKVPPTLHTPLMSGSNAISGITLVGAILAGGAKDPVLSSVLAFLAVMFATVNVVGGFLVTHRMLAMFRKKG